MATLERFGGQMGAETGIRDVMSQFSRSLDRCDYEDKEQSLLRRIFGYMSVASELVDQAKLGDYSKLCQSKLQVVKQKIDTGSRSVDLHEMTGVVQDLIQAFFSSLDKPRSSEDLDLCGFLVRDVHALGHDSSVYKPFAEWVSSRETPIADLGLSHDELLQLAPYLTTVSVVDYERVEERLPLSNFLSACTSVKKVLFFGNDISDHVSATLSTLSSIEEIRMSRCRLLGRLPSFDRFPALSKIALQDMRCSVPLLDFGACKKLRSIRLERIPDFNGGIVLPQSRVFEEFLMNDLPLFNSLLNFEQTPEVKRVSLNLLREFNQRIDLSMLSGLSALEVNYCEKWEGPLLLPSSCQLQLFDLNDSRMFSGELSQIGQYLSLQKVNLTNCRQFRGGVDFSNLKKLTDLILRNCFSYEGNVDCSNADSLVRLDVIGAKKIGIVSYPKHLQSK